MVVRGSACDAAHGRRGAGPGVEGGGDKCVSEGVGAYSLVDPGPSGDAPHSPAGGVTIQAVAIRAEEDRSF